MKSPRPTLTGVAQAPRLWQSGRRPRLPNPTPGEAPGALPTGEGACATILPFNLARFSHE